MQREPLGKITHYNEAVMAKNLYVAASNPRMQFGLRTLLITVTVFAVLAAIAGPFYRRQTPEAQSSLLSFWGSILLCAAAVFFWNIRFAFIIPPSAGRLHYLLSYGWRLDLSPVLRVVWFSITIVGLFVWIAVLSVASSSGATGRLVALEYGISMGVLLGCVIHGFLRRPAPVCENGLVWRGELVPWRYIRAVEWLMDRSGFCRLRRYDGDIVVIVPLPLREEFDGFLRERIPGALIS